MRVLPVLCGLIRLLLSVSLFTVLLKDPRLGIHLSLYFSVVSQDTEENEISLDAKQGTQSVFLVRQQSGIIKFMMFRRFSDDFYPYLNSLEVSFYCNFTLPLNIFTFFFPLNLT